MDGRSNSGSLTTTISSGQSTERATRALRTVRCARRATIIPMPAHRDGKPGEHDTADEVYRKRARGEIACAECRRLKLKCDRKIPCSACTRRGCASICPNGSLKAGQGTRFVLSDTEHLHEKMNQMSERIRVLEDALELLHERFQPGSTHPLLHAEFMTIKNPLRPGADAEADEDAMKKEEKAPDVPGSLAFAPDGSVQYFGRSAGTEMLFMRADSSDVTSPTIGEVVPAEIREFSDAFPFRRDIDAPGASSVTYATLRSYLPAYDRALALLDHYFDNASFYFHPLMREDMMDYVVEPIYRDVMQNVNNQYSTPSSDGSAPTSLHPHALGLVFSIFSVGSAVDLTLPQAPANREAEHYFHLSRAALALKPLFEDTTFETVLAVAYMVVYRNLAEKSKTMTNNHTFISVACLLAQNLGLHRDPARWGLSPRIVEMRRRAFWELNSIDHYQSLTTGCAAFFPSKRVDSELASDADATLSEDGKIRMGFWRWRARLVREVISDVNATMTGAQLPTHAAIMTLDCKIREFFTSNLDASYTFKEQPDEVGHWSVRMQRFMLTFSQSVCLIFVHRTFFAQCCQDHPTRPARSPYAASYLATYKSSISLLQVAKKESERHMAILVRFPHIWTHIFSAAIIVGSAIERGPNNTFASAGLIDLAQAVSLFEKAAETLKRARMALPYLTALLRKAHRAYTDFNTKGLVDTDGIEEDCDSRLAMFGGQTRVFITGPSGSSGFGSSPMSPTASSPSPPGPAAVLAAVQSVSAMNHAQFSPGAGEQHHVVSGSDGSEQWLPGPEFGGAQQQQQQQSFGHDTSVFHQMSYTPPPTLSPVAETPCSNTNTNSGLENMNSIFASPPLAHPSTSTSTSNPNPDPGAFPASFTDFAGLWGMSNLIGSATSTDPSMVLGSTDAPGPRSTHTGPGGVAYKLPAAVSASGLAPRSEDAVNLFGLDPIAGQTQADDSWATFVRETGLFWNMNNTTMGGAGNDVSA